MHAICKSDRHILVGLGDGVRKILLVDDPNTSFVDHVGKYIYNRLSVDTQHVIAILIRIVDLALVEKLVLIAHCS